ncbi:MAG TPA: polysaccharide deacetylase family protein [Methylococcaceae bacterium]|nr:polysaccharide deacetylase family protein [Methylococcaceae bacterium]
MIDRLPTEDKTVALTFDACETITPSHVDESIAGFLLREKIPFTIFVSGQFAVRNRERLTQLAAFPEVELENHSFHHRLHMERLNAGDVEREVRAVEPVLNGITGHPARFFRFPGGYHDAATLGTVEKLGYRVVHWSFASGDPDPALSAGRLYRHVIEMVKPGAILIFHINGRGYRTGEALPRIVDTLRKRGYRFVRLNELL